MLWIVSRSIDSLMLCAPDLLGSASGWAGHEAVGDVAEWAHEARVGEAYRQARHEGDVSDCR